MSLASQFSLAVTSGLVFGSLLALTAVGLSLIFGILDIPNFAQGEFATFAGFATIGLTSVGVPLLVSVVVALALTFVAGAVVERVVISQFYDREKYFLEAFFVTFALTLAFPEIVRLVFGSGFYQIPVPELGSTVVFGTSITYLKLVASGIAVVMLVGLYLFTRHTYLGLAMRAIANDRVGATMIGVDQDRIYTVTFGIGAMITGMTGILYGAIFSLSPSLGVSLTAFAFVIVVFGGVGSFLGTILASLVIGLVDSFTATFVGSRYRLFVVFALLFLVLVVKPTGLWGEGT